MLDTHVAVASKAERARVAGLVAVKRMPGKGVGVVAARDLPAWVSIGRYPGVRYTRVQFDRRVVQRQSDGTYAVGFYKPDVNGVPRTNYVLDPGTPDGKVDARFAGSVTPLVNEPDPATGPNLVWAWNLPRYAMEMYTLRAVRAGEELTVCYGTQGGYQRDYQTACVVRQAEVEPLLHVVTRPGARPVPYSALGNVGVAKAVQALRG